MGYILKNSWALLLGMFLLMLGNGLQGTLLGIRGAIEGFSPTTMSWVMSAYFLGFLGGSRMTPKMIARVGHVRVFAALASMISAAFIIYALAPDPYVWALMRLIVGFSFSGVYVVAESWLNDSATNETRGQALSAYMIVQMSGIVLAQVIINFADPAGFVLFAVISILVSISFAPILLSVSPAPVFHTSKPMTLKRLFKTSPLGCVGSFLLGGIFSIMFGMSAVYGTEVGFTVAEISIFIGTIYTGGVLLQYPIGWLSDRMDRRLLIVIVTGVASVLMIIGLFWASSFYVILVLGFIIGASTSPLYSLLIAHTNDYLEHEDMANASGALIFLNGVGAICTPILVGLAMTHLGANSFFYAMIILMVMITVYGAFRMTRREAIAVEDTMSYTPVLPQTTPIVAEVAQEIAIEQEIEAEEENSP
ncbi:MAG: MFS transporter [Rhodobacteraceae bacterium]|nr:MFS transporter [Paracoccaceae bacterium]